MRDLEAARRQTAALLTGLESLSLLEPFEAHAFGRDGQDHHLRGMLRVSEERLNALDARDIGRLMRQGELSRIYAHLMSLDNFKHLLDRAADILGRVQQGSVDIEQIDGELRDRSVRHAGEGRSPSESPVTRRPTSGRITCCV